MSTVVGFGQKIIVDQEYGHGLKLDFDNASYPKLYYDEGESSLYISYDTSKNDGFSFGWLYLRYGVCKIDLATGEYDSSFGMRGVSEYSFKANFNYLKLIQTIKSNNYFLIYNRNVRPYQLIIIDKINGSQDKSIDLNLTENKYIQSPTYIDKSNDRVLMISGNSLEWYYRNGTKEGIAIPDFDQDKLKGKGVKKIFDSEQAVCFKYYGEEKIDSNRYSTRQNIILYDGDWRHLGEKFATESTIDWVAIDSTLHGYQGINVKTSLYQELSKDWAQGLEYGNGLDFDFICQDDEFLFISQKEGITFEIKDGLVYATEGDEELKCILRRNLLTQQLDTFNIDEVFPDNFELKSFAYTGNAQFVLLLLEHGKKKMRYHLRKIKLESSN